MSWENLLKVSFGSNEGYNKLWWASEIVRDISMSIEKGYFHNLLSEHELLTESVLEKIEVDEDRIKRIVDDNLADKLEILAELFR